LQTSRRRWPIAPRDGNYFNANCTYWNDPPENPTKGFWSFTDYARSGVFIDLPKKHAYVAFCKLGTGRMGYDYAASGSAGAEECWYFYDPRDLGAAAQGAKKPREVLPRSRTNVTSPGRVGDVTGVVFPCGWILDEPSGTIRLYYGGADTCLALATAQLSDVLSYLHTCPVPRTRKRPGMTPPGDE